MFFAYATVGATFTHVCAFLTPFLLLSSQKPHVRHCSCVFFCVISRNSLLLTAIQNLIEKLPLSLVISLGCSGVSVMTTASCLFLETTIAPSYVCLGLYGLVLSPCWQQWRTAYAHTPPRFLCTLHRVLCARTVRFDSVHFSLTSVYGY